MIDLNSQKENILIKMYNYHFKILNQILHNLPSFETCLLNYLPLIIHKFKKTYPYLCSHVFMCLSF